MRQVEIYDYDRQIHAYMTKHNGIDANECLIYTYIDLVLENGEGHQNTASPYNHLHIGHNKIASTRATTTS